MDLETLKALFEFFNIRTFLDNNSWIKLVSIFAIVCILGIVVKISCVFVRKKIEKVFKDKSQKEMSKPHGQNKVIASIDDGIFEQVMASVLYLLYILIIAWGFRQVNFGLIYNSLVSTLFTILCTWMAIKFFSAFIPFNIDIYLRRHGSTLSTSQVRSLMPIIKGVIWAIGLTFLLDNIGLHVSTIIAGLGIMGVAVGLAGQAILSDFFSYIVILLDKPFKIGDFVVLSNGKSGEVIYMGPKTTRLRSLNNNIIVCANAEMTKGILENQGDISEREVIVEVGVAFTVPMEKVKKVPSILEEIVNSYPQCIFERACMINFGTANYLFQLIYHVSPQPGGLVAFMNTQTDVNLALTQRLNDEDIIGAYPTESVFVTQVQPQPATTTSTQQKKDSQS